jgi:hypothetical protein
MKHTPTPWRVAIEPPYEESARIFSGDIYLGSLGNSDQTKDETRANAEFIVRAVNSHDALVAALRRIMPHQQSSTHSHDCGCSYCEAVNALALAEGKE